MALKLIILIESRACMATAVQYTRAFMSAKVDACVGMPKLATPVLKVPIQHLWTLHIHLFSWPVIRRNSKAVEPLSDRHSITCTPCD